MNNNRKHRSRRVGHTGEHLARTALKHIFQSHRSPSDFIEKMDMFTSGEWLRYMGPKPEDNHERTEARIKHVIAAHQWIGKTVTWEENQPHRLTTQRGNVFQATHAPQKILQRGIVDHVLPEHVPSFAKGAYSRRPFIFDGITFSLMTRSQANQRIQRISTLAIVSTETL
jgi:hypothetical protein